MSWACMKPMIALSITLAAPLAIGPPRFIAISIAPHRPGLRQRRAGGDRDAWLEVQAGHAEGDA
jgi:hypothetical protein